MNNEKKKSFLVFSGGNDRAVLSFLRALRLCGERASIVARTRDDRILCTDFREDVKFIRESHELTLSVFTQCVSRIRGVVGTQTLVVLPSTEYFNAFLLKHRAEIESMGCEVPLIDIDQYNLLTGKRSSADYFSAAGFSIPREVDALLAKEPPLVAKPLHNISSQGRSLYPQLLKTLSDLNTFHAKNNIEDYFFQEYLLGESIYLLFYIARDGQTQLTWSQRNLMQQPDGKSMLFAEPADFHVSSTGTQLANLLRLMGFWGLGMIEMIQTTERQVFIEMNPRIWGPAQFCIDQGQPLLQAFIGDALHNDPCRFIAMSSHKKAVRKNYFWLGGLADTLVAGKRPIWHTNRLSIFRVIYAALHDDVYLRRDSWRCFFRDLKRTIKLALRRERTQN